MMIAMTCILSHNRHLRLLSGLILCCVGSLSLGLAGEAGCFARPVRAVELPREGGQQGTPSPIKLCNRAFVYVSGEAALRKQPPGRISNCDPNDDKFGPWP